MSHQVVVDKAWQARQWADGSETGVAITILLCLRHHRLLREGEFNIKKECNGAWRYKRGKSSG